MCVVVVGESALISPAEVMSCAVAWPASLLQVASLRQPCTLHRSANRFLSRAQVTCFILSPRLRRFFRRHPSQSYLRRVVRGDSQYPLIYVRSMAVRLRHSLPALPIRHIMWVHGSAHPPPMSPQIGRQVESILYSRPSVQCHAQDSSPNSSTKLISALRRSIEQFTMKTAATSFCSSSS
jgi:hypothetical protein